MIVLTAVLAVGVASFSQHAAADQGPSAAQTKQSFDATAKREIVEGVVKLMTEDYVFPEVGHRAAIVLTENLAAGSYDAIMDPGAFAHRLTEDLNTVKHDKHLRVRSDEQRPAQQARLAKPKRSEAGFTRVDLLAGNIGYLDLNGFVGKGMFKPVADKAMRLLAGTDALIIDLRGNGGGNPAAVSYFVSFFVDPKAPVHVNDLLRRKPGTGEYRRDVFQTEATPSSYLAKPVVIVTGPNTFSGGEEFAYDMQSLKLATLVGEITGGGANPGGLRRLPAGLSIFVPTGRPENPYTHTNWEGRGVEPEVGTAADQAFAKAYETARKAAGKTPLLASAPSSPDGPDAVMERSLMTPRSTAQAGSEAAIRRSVAEFQAGAPRYDLLSPGLAELTRTQLPQIQAEVVAAGSLQGVTFVEVGLQGEDVYDLKFSKAEWLWSVLLDEDGKVVMADFHRK
ncbi:MAG TPA: S41 family peptidase [Burkholderiaceae bacterium]